MRHRQMVKAADTRNFLNQVSRAINIPAPGRRLHINAAIRSGYLEAQRFKNAFLFCGIYDHA